MSTSSHPPSPGRADRWRARPWRAVLLGALGCALLVSVWWLPALAVVAAAAWVAGRRRVVGRWLLAAALGVAVLAVVVRWVARAMDLPSGLGLVAAQALTVLVCFEVARLVADRTEYRERGWQLAAALDGRERAVAAAAGATERSRIAGEMHDMIGHDLALLSLQIAALQVSVSRGDLDGETVATQLSGLRAGAATTTERLHDIVGLLGGDQEAEGSAEQVVAQARAAGLTVEADLEPGCLERCDPLVRRTVLRALEESVTNAVKHGGGARLRVTLDGLAVDQGMVCLVAENPVPQTPLPARAATGSGRGLPALVERVRALGGALEARPEAGSFVVRLRLPTTARLTAQGTGGAVAAGAGRTGAGGTGADAIGSPGAVAGMRDEARRQVRRGAGRIVGTVVGVATGLVVVLAAAFLAVNLGSSLPPDRFAQIRVGQQQDAAESLLPPFQMPDAPQTVPEPTSDCRYYESRVSFFERVRTFQVCFDAGRVASATDVPAGSSR